MADKKILCVSFDTLVSDSRGTALKEAGYSVTATIKIDEAMELLGAEKFDLVVLGHRFPKAGKQAVATIARQAEVPLVLVCARSGLIWRFQLTRECTRWKGQQELFLPRTSCWRRREQRKPVSGASVPLIFSSFRPRTASSVRTSLGNSRYIAWPECCRISKLWRSYERSSALDAPQVQF